MANCVINTVCMVQFAVGMVNSLLHGLNILDINIFELVALEQFNALEVAFGYQKVGDPCSTQITF